MSPERLVNFGDIAWGEAGADHMARYEFASRYVQGKNVLDVGTGAGYGAVILKASGATNVVATDIDSATITSAENTFGHTGVRFRKVDSESLDEHFSGLDVIVSLENIEHLTAPDKFVQAARKALAPDGLLICSTPARERSPEFVNGRPKNPYHLMEWYSQEFRDLVGSAFSRVEMFSQVESFSLLQRRRGLDTLHKILSHPLRGSSLHNSLRIVSRASRAVGVKSVGSLLSLGGDISGIACPSPSDFPIVPVATQPMYGRLFSHCVVCRI